MFTATNNALCQIHFCLPFPSFTTRSLDCARIRVHRHLFLSFAINGIFWIGWYRWIILDSNFINEHEVRKFIAVHLEYAKIRNSVWTGLVQDVSSCPHVLHDDNILMDVLRRIIFAYSDYKDYHTKRRKIPSKLNHYWLGRAHFTHNSVLLASRERSEYKYIVRPLSTYYRNFACII